MKLYEIIHNLDKSEATSVEINFRALQKELNIENKHITAHHYQHFKCYWIYRKQATSDDCYIGTKAFFMNDEFVFLTTKHKLNTEERYSWVGGLERNAVRNFLAEDLTYRLCDLEEELGEGYSAEGCSVEANTIAYWYNSKVVVLNSGFLGTIGIEDSDGVRHNIPASDLLLPYNINN